MWTTGTGPSYSRTSVNVGDTTGPPPPSPSTAPCTNAVLPAPRSPDRATTSPGRRVRPIARPRSRVSAAERVVSATEVPTASEQTELLLGRLRPRLAQDRLDREEVRSERLELRAGLAAAVQDRRRVKRRQHGAAADLEALPAHAADRRRPVEDEARREIAERHDDAGVDRADLSVQIRLARVDLVGERVAVSGRAALHHVRDVDVRATESDLAEHPGQELP